MDYVQNINRFVRVFNHWRIKNLCEQEKWWKIIFIASWKMYKARFRGGSLFDLLTHERIARWWWCWWMFHRTNLFANDFYGKVLLLSVWRLIGRGWSLLWIFSSIFELKKVIQTMLLSEWWVTFTWSPRCYIYLFFQPQNKHFFPSTSIRNFHQHVLHHQHFPHFHSINFFRDFLLTWQPTRLVSEYSAGILIFPSYKLKVNSIYSSRLHEVKVEISYSHHEIWSFLSAGSLPRRKQTLTA